MKVKIIVIAVFLIVAIAVVAFAQQPQRPVSTTAPVVTDLGPNVALDKDSATALAPLAKQRAELQQQIQTLLVQYQLVNARWRVAEGKALAAANLDPGTFAVDPTGQKFIRRAGGPRPQ